MGYIRVRPEVHRRTKKQLAADTNTKLDLWGVGSTAPTLGVEGSSVQKEQAKSQASSSTPDSPLDYNIKFVLTSKGMQANLGKEPFAMSFRCRKILGLIIQGKTSANELEPSFKDVGVSAKTILVELNYLKKEGLINGL